MAAERNNFTSNFYVIRNHRFIKRVDSKTEDSKTMTTKEGKEYEAEEYANISGKIGQIFINEDEFNGKTFKNVTIQLKDGNVRENITGYLDSDAIASFFKRLPNIDLSREVTIFVRKDKRDGSDYVGTRIDIYQDDTRSGDAQLVPYAFNKENPLPAWEKKTVNGSDVWDKTEMLKKFESMASEANTFIKNIGKSSEDVELSAEVEEFHNSGFADAKTGAPVSKEDIQKTHPGVIFPDKKADDLPF